MKIALTGGHLTPALASIAALKNLEPKIEFVWLGRQTALEGDTTFSVEYTTIVSLGLKFIDLKSGRWQRKFTKFTIPSLARVPQGFWHAFFVLRREKPDLLLSFGGYLSTPVVISAWALKIPILIHEQSASAGLANKINSHFADKIAVSWRQTLTAFPRDKTLFIGNPLRTAVFKKNLPLADRNLASWLKSRDQRKKLTIYVTGGNQGSHFLNQTLIPIFSQLAKKYFLIIQSGSSAEGSDFLELKKEVKRLKLAEDIFVTKYISESDIGTVFSSSDFLLSRSGANIVSEILALGKPAILVPLPWVSSSEQQKNAQIVEQSGLGIVLDQENLTAERLILELSQFAERLSRFEKHKSDAKKLINPRAADLLAKEALSLGKKWK